MPCDIEDLIETCLEEISSPFMQATVQEVETTDNNTLWALMAVGCAEMD